jgi:hypothetical protein
LLEAGDPPTFVRVGPARQSSPVIAVTPAAGAPAAAPEIPAETPPPAKAKGGRKKKAKS